MAARRIGPEVSKTFAARQESGFFARYLSGERVLDIGYRGGGVGAEPILPNAIGVDLDYPGYDGRTLPFADGSCDAVHASHCLEHIGDYVRALQEWHRVLKTGGYIVITVPHQYLYEKRARPPSRWNPDHKRFYTPSSLLAEIESALAPNSYRICSLRDNDRGYSYDIGPDRHAQGCYEIECILQKIAPPAWTVE